MSQIGLSSKENLGPNSMTGPKIDEGFEINPVIDCCNMDLDDDKEIFLIKKFSSQLKFQRIGIILIGLLGQRPSHAHQSRSWLKKGEWLSWLA